MHKKHKNGQKEAQESRKRTERSTKVTNMDKKKHKSHKNGQKEARRFQCFPDLFVLFFKYSPYSVHLGCIKGKILGKDGVIFPIFKPLIPPY